MSKVLVLEDLDSDAHLIKSVLGKFGPYEIVLFDHAQRAIDFLSDQLRTRSELPALIVIDLNLANSSGYELLRFYHATSSLKHVPLVVWSVMDGENDKKLSEWMGAKKLVSKNSGPATLRKSLASLLPPRAG